MAVQHDIRGGSHRTPDDVPETAVSIFALTMSERAAIA
jgi:hypothetical protein